MSVRMFSKSEREFFSSFLLQAFALCTLVGPLPLEYSVAKTRVQRGPGMASPACAEPCLLHCLLIRPVQEN